MGSGSESATVLSIQFSLLISLLILHLPSQNVPSSSSLGSSSSTSAPRTSPVFDIRRLRTTDQLNHFYRILTEIVSDPPGHNQQHRELNVAHSSTQNVAHSSTGRERYLTYVELTDGTDRLTLLLRSYDLYIVGYRVNDNPAIVLRHGLPMIPQPFVRIGSFLVQFGEAPENYNYFSEDRIVRDADSFLGSYVPLDEVQIALGLLGIDYTRIGLGDSYPDLEFAGHMRRMDMPINENNLLRAFTGLINSGSEAEIARSILFFTQFISEALRINPIREYVIRNFQLSARTPDHLLILEHGWGRASLCLHRQNSDRHSLEYGGSFPGRVSLQEMDRIYAITRRNPMYPHSHSRRYTRVNMWAHYEYTLLEYERRRQEEEMRRMRERERKKIHE